MNLRSFNTIYPTAAALYGVNADPINLEEMALVGWELIGNKHTRLYRYTGDAVNGRLQLPCNVNMIESVTVPFEDGAYTNNKIDGYDSDAIFTEHYVEAHKRTSSPIYQSGKLIKYREEGDELVFDRNYKRVCVVYHGIITDDEGLPLITDKEVRALAMYIAYSDLYKQGLMRKDSGLLQMSSLVKADWLKACSAARVPEYMSKNDMNDILDVKTRWDRKAYGRTYKPIL